MTPRSTTLDDLELLQGFICIYCIDIARRSSARGRQTTVSWQKQVFIHTQLSRTCLVLA